MQLTESSIYINMKRLRDRLYSAQFHMNKADRVIYGTPLMEASGEALGAFVLAFMVKDRKLEYMELCIGWFTRLRIDLEFCVQQNIIKFKKRKVDTTAPDFDSRDEVNSQKIELFRLIATIDDDIHKWRAALAKGKIPHDKETRECGQSDKDRGAQVSFTPTKRICAY